MQHYVFAQNSSTSIMTSNGKLGVVVTVVLVILFGLFFYVYTIDKKIKKMENNT
jgi:hypothetical protein